MVSRVRIYVLLQLILALNWVLSKLMVVIAHESIHKLNLDFDEVSIQIKDNYCYLDECYDEEENDRKSLSMWKHRIKAED